jgi:O-antigen/teichoic acid export membrane protein
VTRPRALVGRGDVLLRFADTALVSIGNFATSVLVGRILGPRQFGVFALLWTVVALALMIQWASITSPMQSSLAQSDADPRIGMFGSLWWHSAIVGLLAGLGAVVIVLCAGEMRLSVATSAGITVSVVSIVLQDFARRWLLATERPGWALASDGLRQAGSLLVLALISGTMTVTLSFSMLVIGAGAAVGCAPLISDFRSVPLRSAAPIVWAKRHSEFARWLMPSVVLQSINAAAPLYLLGALLGVGSAGGYRAAVALASPIVILSEALETFLPLRARQATLNGGLAALRRILRSYAVLFFPLCIAYVGLISAFGSEIMEMTYGRSYTIYAPLLLTLGLASLVQFLTYLLNVGLRAIKRSDAILTADIAATVVLIAGLLSTISHATVTKAAVCVVAHQGAKLLVLLVSTRRAQSRVMHAA